jgi:hypothetical protein
MVTPSLELWLLGFARAIPVVVLHPIFGGSSTPRAVKLAVAAALAAVAANPSGTATLQSSPVELAIAIA